MTETPVDGPAESTDLRVAQAWLDALTSGNCDEAAFLQAVPTFTRDAPETGWDLLSLVDQYYRRGKIPSESFQHLKSHLEARLLRAGLDVGISVPLPQGAQQSPAADRTVPIVVPVLQSAVEASAEGAPVAAPQSPPARVDPRPIAAGELLRGRYLIKGVLGLGGMGTVFEAVDQYRLNLPHSGQSVAIKVLHTAASDRPELHEDLRREFQNLQSLSHPNIVRVHEYDRDGDIAFFTMEHLSGRTLAQILAGPAREELRGARALSIIRDVGAALAFAHVHDVVHGDLNPGNIFITDKGEVRVLDFGASHRLRGEPWIAESDAPAQTPFATPRYASCQLLEGDSADARDDVYAFASIAYLLLTGTHAFGERTAREARSAKMRPARPRGITAKQWRALRSGLAFDRAARPSDMQKWLAPFSAASTAEVPAGRRHRLPALIVVGLAASALGWWAATIHESLTGGGGALEPHPTAAPVQSELLPKAGPDSPAPAAQAVTAASAEPAPQLAPAAPPPAAPVDVPAAGAAIEPAPAAPAAPSAPAAKSPPMRARIELAASTLEVPPMSPTARVVVRRSGNVQSTGRFSWWTESGTAKPGRDFAPVTAHEQFEAGKSSMNLYIPIIADSTRRKPKNFYVVIGDARDGAYLGTRTLMMVTIPPLQ